MRVPMIAALMVACTLAHVHMCSAMAKPGRTLTALSTPLVGKRFNYQIGEPFDMLQHALPGVDVYFIDLFDNNASTIAAMKEANLTPVCYFSAGVYKSSWADAGDFPESVLGTGVSVAGAEPGQRWLDVRSSVVRSNIAKRFQLCKEKGFVAADPGNTDAYLYDNGFNLQQADLQEYVLWLAEEAHKAGLQVGLLNSVALIDADVAKEFDFAINTACHQLNECDKLAPFKDAGKPVYHIEFSSSAVFAADVCTKQETYGLISVRKEKDLGAFPYVTCPTVAASKLTKAESLTASSIATTFVMLSISGGSLSFTPATNDARLTNFPEPAAKPVFLNGSVTMVGTSGLGLLLGPGIFAVKRQVDWVYDPASKTYTAHTNVEGAVQLVKYAGSGNKNAEKQRSLACNVKGPLRLTSQSYPGPGANGKYNWAGNLTISPNPWIYWAKDESSAARRLLAGDDIPPVTIQVEGLIGAAEDTGDYPSAAEDAKRNDGSHYLDAEGNVRVANGKDVPPEDVPDWKTNPPRDGKRLAIPVWLLGLLVALGGLFLLVMLLWALLLVLRRRREAQQAAAADKKEPAADPKLEALRAEAAVTSGRASGYASPRHSAGGAADKV